MIDKTKYLVIDIETNGLRSKEHDLLSISIFKPDDQKSFNKFLPLELDDCVLTTQFNGIKDSDLANASHLTQKELDSIIEDFDVKNRIILHYGDLDPRFLREYLKRKGLKGFDLFNFFNIKNLVFSSSWQNNVTKDNLCNIFGISGVKPVHDGLNDCILEWKLFEAMDNNSFIVINNSVFKLNKDYVLPVSTVSNYKKLKKSLPHLPEVAIKTKLTKSCQLPKGAFNFGSNISGISIEKIICAHLNATFVDNTDFISSNLLKLDYIGTLPTEKNEILVTENQDGTLSSVSEKDESFVQLINIVSKAIREASANILDYIKEDIFHSLPVLSQELIINHEHNLLALCDLSNEHAVVEIKAGKNLNLNDFALQLFIESNNRPCYLLIINWEENLVELHSVEFVFGEEAKKEHGLARQSLLQAEAKKLQKQFFDDKELEIITYKGKTCNSEFLCKNCGNFFIMKHDLTHMNIDFLLECPYCNPKSEPHRYEKLSKSDWNTYHSIYWRKEKGKPKIYNWITKKEIYLTCDICNHVWVEKIKTVLTSECPICKKASR